MTVQNVVALLSLGQDVGDLSFANWGKGRPSRELAKLIEGLGDGAYTGSIDIQNQAGYGCGILAISGGAGADGGTIGGKLVTATFATSDANTSDLVAAAIIADATAGTYCTAQSRVATGTLTIAAGSGLVTANLGTQGGVSGQAGVSVAVTWATSDTVTAAALAAAVNATANSPVIASSLAGVVTFYATSPGSGSTNTGGNAITLSGTGTGVSVSAATLTNGGTNPNVLVKCLVPGTVGNGITLVASGTGVTAPTGANLVGGLGKTGSNTFTC